MNVQELFKGSGGTITLDNIHVDIGIQLVSILLGRLKDVNASGMEDCKVGVQNVEATYTGRDTNCNAQVSWNNIEED